MKKIIASLIVTWILTLPVAAQQPTAHEMNTQLGRGINMGNMYEAPSEEAWGNPWKPGYFDIIADLGFNHVRIPIRWEPEARSMDEPPYTIYQSFLERIREVVDSALAHNLKVIINMHHHNALYEDPEGQKPRFLAQWQQIAAYFSNYSDNVLFEVLNEPHGNLTPQLWNSFLADALDTIRTSNPNRFVLIGTASYGGISGIKHLELPEDERLILTIHYYNPFHFTHQGAEWVGPHADAWLGTKWYDTEPERQTIRTEFRPIIHFLQQHNIPVHIGEFGAYSKADMASRSRWTTFLARWFEEKGFSWAYWEFSAGFGIYNPDTQTLRTPLVDALLHNTMPEPTPAALNKVYNSNFSEGPDGWNFYTHNQAQGTMTHSGEKLSVEVTETGTESWHAQLIRGDIPLEKNKKYKLAFQARAPQTRSISCYTGMNTAPWEAYSSTFWTTVDTALFRYVFTFSMQDTTDPAARIAFDLGRETGSLELHDISLATVDIQTGLEQTPGNKIRIAQYPEAGLLKINSAGNTRKVELFAMSGRKLKMWRMKGTEKTISVADFPEGIYILRITLQNGTSAARKVLLH